MKDQREGVGGGGRALWLWSWWRRKKEGEGQEESQTTTDSRKISAPPTVPPTPWGVLESKQAEGEFPHLQGPGLREAP